MAKVEIKKTSAGGGGGGNVSFTSVTYAQLVSLIGASGLVQGDSYLITDFQTIYDQPDYDAAGLPKASVSTLSGSIEPIIVEAISTTEISSQALSTIYENDQLLYDWTFQNTEIMGAAAKGRITKRITSVNNITSYDSRAVLFKRYETVSGSGIYNSYKDTGFASLSNIPTFGSNCYNNIIPFYKNLAYPFLLPNSVFGNDCYDNTIGDGFYNNTLRNNIINNVIGNNFSQNYVAGSFNRNNIESVFQDNSIGNIFQRNTIGTGFYQNTIYGDFNDNFIGDYFEFNDIQQFFDDNRIGNYFGNNIIATNFKLNQIGNYFGYDSSSLNKGNTTSDDFKNNKIGNYFYDNNLGTTFRNNVITDEFNTNTTGSSFVNNTIKDYFNNNNIGSGFINNNVGTYFSNNTIGTNFKDNIISNYFGSNSGFGSFPNTIGDEFKNNTIGETFSSNVVGNMFKFNVIGDECYANTIGQQFMNNQIGTYFQYNSNITDFVKSNKIGDYFWYNSLIGTYFQDNVIGNFFGHNSIGSGFGQNQIGDFFGTNDYHDDHGNTIGGDCRRNVIGDYFSYNTVGNNFMDNKIGNFFGTDDNVDPYPNTIGDDFMSNTLGNNFRSNSIGNTFKNNEISDFFNNNTITFDFLQNRIGNYFQNNTSIGNNFKLNQIGNYFINNTLIDDYFQGNQIGSYFGTDLALNSGLGNSIGYNFASNVIGDFFNQNTVEDNVENMNIQGYFQSKLILANTNTKTWVGGLTTGSVSNTDGFLESSGSLSGYVPYTGATADVDLGSYNLTADHIALNVSPSGAGFVEGATQWNNSDGTSETLLKGGSVALKNGVDLVARIVNKVVPNQTLTKAQYQVVRVSGASGQRLAVNLAQANNDINSADTIGIVIETIPTNQQGFIMAVGQLTNINTTGSLQGETWTDGDVLYLSPTTAGAVTNIKPNGLTGHIVVIGYVEYAHVSQGKIYVKVMNGWELSELHDCYINPVTLANNDVLAYDSTAQLWENKTISTVIGGSPITGSGTTNYVSKFSGTGTLANSLIRDDGTTIGFNVAPSASSLISGATTNMQVGLTIINSNVSGSTFASSFICNGTKAAQSVGLSSLAQNSSIQNIGVIGRANFATIGENIGGSFIATNGGNNYAIQLQDGVTELVANRFLTNITTDGKARWATLTVADTGLTLTTTSTSGAATLVGNTLNIPIYDPTPIPVISGNSVFNFNNFI